jgi:Alcohol dehydrogenase, class IV
MAFSFSTASPIIFGAGTVSRLPELVKSFGKKTFLVIDAHISLESPFISQIEGEIAVFHPDGEPTVQSVADATELARQNGSEVIVGIGGGSAIDTAKAVGILLPSGGKPLDYLEVVGDGKPLPPNSLPVIAVPTTAGTGAEVTANTPLFSAEHGVKASLRSPAMLPDIALIDPKLTVSCPSTVTASSGLDALTQCLEPFTSCKANELTNILAAEGLKRAGQSLRTAFTDGQNIDARVDMSFCSLLGGMALANAKLGSVHALAAPLGGMLGAPHGMVCAAVLVACTRMNIRALGKRDPNSPALSAYRQAMQLLTGNPKATIEEGIAWLVETVEMLNVSSLGEMGMKQSQIDLAASQALVASSMAGNPIKLELSEVVNIIQESM